MFKIFKFALLPTLFFFANFAQASEWSPKRSKWINPVRDYYSDSEMNLEDNEMHMAVLFSELEKSLFYQGFFHEDTLKNGKPVGAFIQAIPPEAFLRQKAIVRNEKKAVDAALLAKGKFSKSNLANLYLSGIGVEKNPQKALEVLGENLYANKTPKEIESEGVSLALRAADPDTAPIFAYIYYYGLGLEKDVEKCNAILNLAYFNFSWRNFYCGYLAPKDFDFAIHALEVNKEFWASKTLSEIYEGKYLSEHANAAKAEHWQKVYEEKSKVFFKELFEENKKELADFEKERDMRQYSKIIFLYGAKKRIFSSICAYNDIVQDNPFYSPEKLDIELKKLKEFCKNDKEFYSTLLSGIYTYSTNVYSPQGRADDEFASYIQKLSKEAKE